jgi:hypothetical protein
MQTRCFWPKTLCSAVLSGDFWEASTSEKIMPENGLSAVLSPQRTEHEKALKISYLYRWHLFIRVYFYIDLPSTLESKKKSMVKVAEQWRLI